MRFARGESFDVCFDLNRICLSLIEFGCRAGGGAAVREGEWRGVSCGRHRGRGRAGQVETQILEGYVTKFAPHQALKLTA